MKTLFSTTLAFVLFLTSAPALARTGCEGLRGTERVACMRLKRQSDALKQGDTSNFIRRNTGVLNQVQRNRRSDLKDRTGVTRSTGANRIRYMENLRERRQSALQRRNDRILQNRDRENATHERRNSLLRNRLSNQVHTSTRAKAMTRDAFRARTREMHEQVQDRRSAVKKAHVSCRTMRGSERFACLKAEREQRLNATQ